MWIKRDSFVFRDDLVSKRTGNTYSAWVLTGTKIGGNDRPDEEGYRKIFFDNQTADVIEKGVTRPDINIVSFIANGTKDGDTIEIKVVQQGQNWKIVHLKNLSEAPVEYKPLSADQLAQMANTQMQNQLQQQDYQNTPQQMNPQGNFAQQQAAPAPQQNAQQYYNQVQQNAQQQMPPQQQAQPYHQQAFPSESGNMGDVPF